MKGRIAIAVAAITLALSMPAAAYSGSDGLFYCETRPGMPNGQVLFFGDCLGTVGTLISIASALHPAAKFCPPKEVTTLQAVQVVKKALRDHPETLHEDFVTLAHTALLKAWPCGGAR